MADGTKLSISKELNRDLNIRAAEIGIHKTKLIEALVKVPLSNLIAFLHIANEPRGSQDEIQ